MKKIVTRLLVLTFLAGYTTGIASCTKPNPEQGRSQDESGSQPHMGTKENSAQMDSINAKADSTAQDSVR